MAMVAAAGFLVWRRRDLRNWVEPVVIGESARKEHRLGAHEGQGCIVRQASQANRHPASKGRWLEWTFPS
jgi:hypothetical protein